MKSTSLDFVCSKIGADRVHRTVERRVIGGAKFFAYKAVFLSPKTNSKLFAPPKLTASCLQLKMDGWSR